MSIVLIVEVLRRGTPLEPHEAVAVVQQLIHHPSPYRTERGFRSACSYRDDRYLDRRLDCTPTLSVVEAAILLQKLTSTAPLVPRGLQYLIGRALHQDDWHSFGSLEEFSAELRPHEQGDRHVVVQTVGRRLGLDPAALDDLAGDSRTDRRAIPPIVAELRRQLRDADRARFEMTAPGLSRRSAFRRAATRVRVPAIVASLATGLAFIAAGDTHRLLPRRAIFERGTVDLDLPPPPKLALAIPDQIIPVALTTQPEGRRRALRGLERPAAPGVRVSKPIVKRAAAASRTPKPKRRRFLGIPFFM
jgi:hypothetical protein